MVLNATFNNISAISWRSVLLVKEIGSIQAKPPIGPKLLTNLISHNVVSSISRYGGVRTQQLWWWQELIARVVVNIIPYDHDHDTPYIIYVGEYYFAHLYSYLSWYEIYRKPIKSLPFQ